MATSVKKIFPNTTSSNLTAPFNVKNGIGILRIANWSPKDRLSIEVRMGDDCDNQWIPVTFCCGTLSTSHPSTHMLIPIPGHYRGVLYNTDNEHVNDPTHFDDVKIEFEVFEVNHSVADYYQLCC